MSAPEPGEFRAGSAPLSDADWQSSLPSLGDPVHAYSTTTPAPQHPVAAAQFEAATAASRTIDAAAAPPSIFGAAPRPPAPPQGMYRDWAAPPTTAHTAAVWWLVFVPMITVAAQCGLLLMLVEFDPIGLVTRFEADPESVANTVVPQWYLASLAVSLVSVAVTILLGYRDRAAIRALGHPRSASPWWLLLHMLVYLGVRRHHLRPTPGSMSPIAAGLLLYMLPFAIGIALVVVSILTASPAA